jgi:Protein of unknown function (DUF3738)
MAKSNAATGENATEPNGAISLQDAISTQLGLKLEKRQRPVPVLVIDHIEEKPTGFRLPPIKPNTRRDFPPGFVCLVISSSPVSHISLFFMTYVPCWRRRRAAGVQRSFPVLRRAGVQSSRCAGPHDRPVGEPVTGFDCNRKSGRISRI